MPMREANTENLRIMGCSTLRETLKHSCGEDAEKEANAPRSLEQDGSLDVAQRHTAHGRAQCSIAAQRAHGRREGNDDTRRVGVDLWPPIALRPDDDERVVEIARIDLISLPGRVGTARDHAASLAWMADIDLDRRHPRGVGAHVPLVLLIERESRWIGRHDHVVARQLNDLPALEPRRVHPALECRKTFRLYPVGIAPER